MKENEIVDLFLEEQKYVAEALDAVSLIGSWSNNENELATAPRRMWKNQLACSMINRSKGE